MRTWARWDREVLRTRATEIDELHRAAGTPITARRPWLQAWLDTHPDVGVLAVGVETDTGRLEAIALLAEHPGRVPAGWWPAGTAPATPSRSRHVTHAPRPPSPSR